MTPPSKEFEKEWQNIELKNNDIYLFLANTPRYYAYFMNKGLLIKSSQKNVSLRKLKKQALCFEIDQKQIIQKISCEK